MRRSLLANDRSYAFVAASNPSDTARSIGPLTVTLAKRRVVVPVFTLAARSARLIPVGLAVGSAGARATANVPATPPPFADAGAVTLQSANARLRVAFAPNAGARIAELSAPGFTNAATSIGLLRDAVDPEPSPSARDYIAAYTHPLPAGTFNRTYDCAAVEVGGQSGERCCVRCARSSCRRGALCAYARACKRRRRTGRRSRVRSARSEINDPLAEHFRVCLQSRRYASQRRPAHVIGVLHGTRLVVVRWRRGDVAHVDLRQTRGAELVTLIFARRSVELRLSVLTARDATEAQRLLGRESAVASRGSGGMADAAASKAAEATHVGSTPTFPMRKPFKIRCVRRYGCLSALDRG